VDAICINQKDDKERGHQVGMMRDVYSKATDVLVWLGESSKDVGTLNPVSQSLNAASGVSPSFSQLPPEVVFEHKQNPENPSSVESQQIVNSGPTPVSDLFLDYLHRTVAEIRRIRNSGQDPKSSPLYQELLSQVYERSYGGMDTDLRRGFKDIVKRRWWSRVWVVQEVAIAKSATLICSSRSINYDDFFQWHLLLMVDPTPKATRVWANLRTASDHLQAVSHARDERATALQVLRWACNLTASDPRDSIFGILGLSDKFESLLPFPDYSRSTTQIFTDVAKRHLTQTKSLVFLENASIRSYFGYPSWVPYWSGPLALAHTQNPSYRASKSSEAIFKISSDDQELQLQGKEFDRVKNFPLPDQKGFRSVTREEKIRGWRNSCDVGFSLKTYPTGEPVKEALWRTLCWNLDEVYGPLSIETGDSFEEWYHILTTAATVEENRERMRTTQNSFESKITAKSPLCTTARGYLAAVPDITEVGDYIVVFAGGNVPFVLRPTEDRYRLVGSCYVHGIMNGETFPENLDELKWFSIW
jgi:hypothetical protein